MLDSHIYLFKNLADTKLSVGFVNIKEQFIKNSFIDEPYVLFLLSDDGLIKKEILFSKIKNHLLSENGFTIKEFTLKFNKEISEIYNYKINKSVSFSWLEIFQIAVILENQNITEKLIENCLKILKNFKKHIEEDY